MSGSSNASKPIKPSAKPKPPAPTPRNPKTKVRAQTPKASLSAAKRRAAQTRKAADKKLSELSTAEKVLKGEAALITTDILDGLPPTVREELADPEKIIFKPTPRQVLFLAAEEDEVFYGGARGGGKSYAMLVDPLRYCESKNHRALMLRRTMPELRDMIAKSHMLYPKAFPGAKWREQDKEWRFPSGARIEFGYAENMIDALRYQGQSYSWIGVDELPQFPTAEVWNFLRSSLRSVDPTVPAFMRCCVDEGDVLTEFGWKPIQEVNVGEKVWSVDELGKAHLMPVTATHAFDVDEDLVRIRKKNLYMSMTADHRVVYQPHGSRSFKITRWNEYSGKSINVARAAASYESTGYVPPVGAFDPDTYAEFLGLYIAEGCAMRRNYHRRVVITQNKKENHEFVWRVMRASGMSVCLSKNGDFEICNKALYEHLAPLGKANQKHFPRDFLNKASARQLKLAFNAYALGDGHWQSDTSVMLYTTSKQLVDDIQEICYKLGYKSQFSVKEHSNPAWATSYCVYVCTGGNVTKVDKNLDNRNDVALERYVGKVYCLTVDGHDNFVLRQRSCVWLSGNTGNPGNVGSLWVKEMFIDPAPSNTRFDVTVKLNHPTRGPIESSISRRYIPSTVFDNPYLTYDDKYITMLASLPDVQRRQFLEGDWSVFDGAAFSEFKESVHVVQPFEVPSSWTRFRAADWGYSSPACCLWFAVDPDNVLYVYRELYVKGQNAEQFAQLVLDAEYGEAVRYGILDASTWSSRGDVGPSIAETMIRYGCPWRPSDRSPKSRVNGKLEVHRRLAVDPHTEQPRMKIFANCRNLIRTLPMLPLDDNNQEDIDTTAEDHAYDALRYGVMSRPLSHETPYDLRNISRTSSFRASDSTFGY